jgi:hypothetical protein
MPSRCHNLLAHQALAWIGNRATGRGQRGGFEIVIAPSYIADVVSLGFLQHRHSKRYGIIEKVNGGLEFIPEVVCVFECKASRSDFLSTFNNTAKHQNRLAPIGSLHWCVTKKDVCKPKELPEFWGLLVQRGNGLLEIKPPIYNKTSYKVRLKIAYELLWYGIAYRPWKSHVEMRGTEAGE